jgi:hypothetical protein
MTADRKDWSTMIETPRMSVELSFFTMCWVGGAKSRAPATIQNGLAILRRLILQHVRTMRLRTNWKISVSTFSDNVVISQPICAETIALIAHMAITQIASSMKGFLLRGGITIGDIVHDEEAVFGPGLNRAYELESEVARYPRFVIDREAFPHLGNLGDLPVDDNGIIFLDPFRLEFIQYIREAKLAVSREELLEAGLP